MSRKIFPSLFIIVVTSLLLPKPSQAQTYSKFELLINRFLAQNHNCIDENALNVLIDQDHALNPSYQPNDLVSLNNIGVRARGTQFLRQEAARYLNMLLGDLDQKTSSTVYVHSAYRSYDHQTSTFINWSKLLGGLATTRTAPAGHSEHQLGTVVDFALEGNRDFYKDSQGSPEFLWLADNAHRYGFTLSYRENNQDRTGYQFEPWHWRYVGVNLATKIKVNGTMPQDFYHPKNCATAGTSLQASR